MTNERLWRGIALLIVILLFVIFPLLSMRSDGLTDEEISNLVLYPVCRGGWEIYNFNDHALTLDFVTYTFDESVDTSDYNNWRWIRRDMGAIRVKAGSQEEPAITQFRAPAERNVNFWTPDMADDAVGVEYVDNDCSEDFHPIDQQLHQPDVPETNGASDCTDLLHDFQPDTVYSGTFEVRLGSQVLPIADIHDGHLIAVLCADQWLDGLTLEGFVDGQRVVGFKLLSYPLIDIYYRKE